MCDIEEGRRLAHYQAQARIAELQEQRDDLVEALRSIENDDGRIPAAIWAMRNAALAKVQS